MCDYIHAIYTNIWKNIQKGFVKYPFMELIWNIFVLFERGIWECFQMNFGNKCI